MITGGLYLTAFELCGVLIAARLMKRHGFMARLWLGLTLGCAMLMWFPSLFAFAFGFTMRAQMCALALAVALAIPAAVLLLRRPEAARCASDEEPPRRLLLFTALPVFLVMTFMLCTHTLRPEGGALYTGQSTYGDMNLHLGIVTGLVDAAYPPEYTLLPGTLLGYPFLTDAMSASLYMTGMPLRQAFLIPGVLMSALAPWGFVMLAWEMTKSKRAVALAAALMFLNGGFGFAYIFDLAGKDPSRLTEMMTGFYKAPANLVDDNVRWVNVLVDMMLPQRTLLGGWTLLIPALWLLVRAVKEQSLPKFVSLGVWAGAMPMVHTHSFMALGLLSAGALLYALIKANNGARGRLLTGFLIYGGLAVALALPQLLTWTFPQTIGGHSLKIRFNWANNQGGRLVDEYFWFWLKNVGPVLLVLVPAGLYAKKSQRMMAVGALAIFVVTELIQFQPNEYDNNKLFYVAYMVMTPLAAQYLVALYDKMRGLPGRRFLAGVFIAVSVCSGALSVARECVSNYRLYGPGEVQAAAYINENTEQRAVFLTGQQHNNAVSTLTGRSLVCGTPTFLYFHGVDYSRQQADARLMYEAPLENRALLEQYGVSYIYISSYERANFAIDEDGIAQLADMVFEADGVRIYKVTNDGGNGHDAA